MTEALPRYAEVAKSAARPPEPELPDYVKLVTVHNRRRKK